MKTRFISPNADRQRTILNGHAKQLRLRRARWLVLCSASVVSVMLSARQTLGDSILTGLSPLDSETVIDPTVTVQATASGSAVAGTYVRNGTTMTTSDKQAAAANEHAAEYDGSTQFTANYTIALKPDNTVDSTNSTVTFVTINYTAKGKLVTETPPGFTTLPITITAVTLNPDNSVASFDFNSTNWYPPTATGAGGLNNNGLSGSINLNTGAASYTASYGSKSNGAVYTYSVTGQVVPEPGTWMPAASALCGIALVAYRRREKVRKPVSLG